MEVFYGRFVVSASVSQDVSRSGNILSITCALYGCGHQWFHLIIILSFYTKELLSKYPRSKLIRFIVQFDDVVTKKVTPTVALCRCDAQRDLFLWNHILLRTMSPSALVSYKSISDIQHINRFTRYSCGSIGCSKSHFAHSYNIWTWIALCFILLWLATNGDFH